MSPGFRPCPRNAPVSRDVDLGDGAAPALLAVEHHEPLDEGCATDLLKVGVERGADGEAACIELVLAVLGEERAADFFGKVFGCEDVGRRPGGSSQ